MSKHYVLKKTSKQDRRRIDLLSKKTSDVHACDKVSSFSPKNVTHISDTTVN